MELINAVKKNDINEVIRLCNLDRRSKFTGQSDQRSDCPLLNTDIDINLQNEYGWTTLMYSSYYGDIDIVRLLLKREDIHINIQNDDRRTALMIASEHSHTNIVKLLCNFDRRSKFTGQSGFQPDCSLLEKENIDINIQDNIGRTALIIALRFYKTDIVKLLNEYNSLLSLTNLI
jgi:ankyrin repeat protein